MPCNFSPLPMIEESPVVSPITLLDGMLPDGKSPSQTTDAFSPSVDYIPIQIEESSRNYSPEPPLRVFSPSKATPTDEL
jgi:hypothetical protein